MVNDAHLRFYESQLNRFKVRWGRYRSNLIYQLSDIKNINREVMESLITFLFDNLFDDLTYKGFLSNFGEILDSNKLVITMLNDELDRLHNPDNKFHHVYGLIIESLLYLSKIALNQFELYEVRHNIRGFCNEFIKRYYDNDEKRFSYEWLKTI